MNTLPLRPSLDQLKKQARELLTSFRSAEPEAIRLFAELHPHKGAPGFSLHDAQLVLARSYGQPSWPRLKEEVERLNSDFAERVRRFVIDAVEGDIRRARRAWQQEPELARAGLWPALVLGDVDFISRAVTRDSAVVRRTDGPLAGRTPLLYVSFSRLQEDAESGARFAECARLLLEAGADANASYELPSWPGSPLKSLYGATGVNDNPALARQLIAHGAELNDGESIYHAAQYDHRESMEVLKEAGVSLGLHPHWKNTPLYFLLGAPLPPATKRGVRWLLDAGCDPDVRCEENDETALHVALRANLEAEVVRWLLEAGADANAATNKGIVPLALAHRSGRRDLVELLGDYGARAVELSAKERFFEAALQGDAESAKELLRVNEGLQFEENDRLTLNRAAEQGRVEAVRALLDCGFDITFKGPHPWGSTPLHVASWQGQADVVELLLERGAPVDVQANPPEDSLPLGWAAHGSQHCGNPHADHVRVVRALLAAGSIPHPGHAEMASEPVADVLHAALAGRGA